MSSLGKYGYIYRIVNLTNSKTYIGQRRHSLDLGKSWDFYLGSGLLIQQAIKKYGKSSFRKELVAEASSPAELNRLETFFINEEIAAGKGQYNLFRGAIGGDTFSKKSPNDKEKLRLKNSEGQKKSAKRATQLQKLHHEALEKANACLIGNEEQILSLFKQKVSMLEIGRKLNISPRAVRRFLVANELPMRKDKNTLHSDETKAKISIALSGRKRNLQ